MIKFLTYFSLFTFLFYSQIAVAEGDLLLKSLESSDSQEVQLSLEALLKACEDVFEFTDKKSLFTLKIQELKNEGKPLNLNGSDLVFSVKFELDYLRVLANIDQKYPHFHTLVLKIFGYYSLLVPYCIFEDREEINILVSVFSLALNDYDRTNQSLALKGLGYLRKRANRVSTLIEEKWNTFQDQKLALWALESVTDASFREEKSIELLEVGEMAPLFFEVTDQKGQAHALTDFYGEWVFIYFYPKNNTPDCTIEACGFRDHFDSLKERVKIIGVSEDTEESHELFATQYRLPFLLLADTQKRMIHKYGVGGMFFSKRHSFLINAKGKIVKIYREVVPSEHAVEVLQDAQKLQQPNRNDGE